MPDNLGRLIGGQIAKCRKERDLTQAQLAEIVNVASETISRLERGVSIPSIQTIDNICRVLQVSLKDLFDFESSRKAKISETEKEVAKVITLLKTRRLDEIRLGYQILKDVFGAVKKFG